MKIKVISGDIAAIKTGAIMVSTFEDNKAPEGDLARLDRLLDGAISQLMKQGEIKGKLSEVTVIHTLGRLPAQRVVITGLGKKKGLTQERVRRTVGDTVRYLQKKGVLTLASLNHGAGVAGISPRAAAQAVTEGARLGSYSFRQHQTEKTKEGKIKELAIMSTNPSELAALKEGLRHGNILAEATNLARDMVNEPANYMTPGHMANVAARLAKDHQLELTVLEKAQIEELGMGGLLGVNQGSAQPPKFIVLNYRGRKQDKIDLALVGKGITFDSGGISIKPSESMGEMKGDMAGGAAVMAAISAIARLKPKVNVVVLVPATENLPDASAIKPGDVLTAMNGKTVEIISTDAEGRLILADALCYAGQLSARRIIDVATLTGACHIALGDVATGAFGNNQELVDRLLSAAAEAGEYTWQMPMYEEYKEQNKSTVADIKNSGGRYGGAITAAQFLAEFVGETPWVHLDIAGTFMTDKEHGYQNRGATGVAVRTLVNLALSLAH